MHGYTKLVPPIIIPNTDVTGVRIHGMFRAIYVFNIYNNCENNGSLDVVGEFMRRNEIRAEARTGAKEEIIWLGNFNRHHPMWDEERNAHLFTKAALEAVQPLLDMLSDHDM